MRFSVPDRSRWSLACFHFESSQAACSASLFLPRGFRTRLSYPWSSSLLPSASRFKKPTTRCALVPKTRWPAANSECCLVPTSRTSRLRFASSGLTLFDPQEFRWTYYLATVQAALGDPAQAVSTFRKSLRLKADYQPAQLKLAEALLASGKSEESRQHYESILQRFPDSALAHYGMGRVKSGQKDLVSAIVHFRRACEISPNFGASHYALALAYRDLDDKTKAQEHLSLYQKDKLGWPLSHDPLLDAVQELRIGAHHYLKQGRLHVCPGRCLREARKSPERAAIHSRRTRTSVGTRAERITYEH